MASVPVAEQPLATGEHARQDREKVDRKRSQRTRGDHRDESQRHAGIEPQRTGKRHVVQLGQHGEGSQVPITRGFQRVAGAHQRNAGTSAAMTNAYITTAARRPRCEGELLTVLR